MKKTRLTAHERAMSNATPTGRRNLERGYFLRCAEAMERGDLHYPVPDDKLDAEALDREAIAKGWKRKP